MQHTIKAPRTVRELGEIADMCGLKPSEVWVLLEEVLGERWWEHDADDFEDFTLSDGRPTSAFQMREGRTSTPPAGYLREKGSKGSKARKERFVGPERLAREWMLTPTWNAQTNEHAIELWSAVDAKLTPAKARKFAVALLELAESVEAAGTTED